jgi:V8-like Glu-specific endopeptidase
MHYDRHGTVLGSFHYIGSAFLVDKDVLVTAGHNIMPSNFTVPNQDGTETEIPNAERQQPTTVTFYRFCIAGEGEISQVVKRMVHPVWKDRFSDDHDISVLSLQRPFSPTYKLPMKKLVNLSTATAEEIEVSGYPGRIKKTEKAQEKDNEPLGMYASPGKTIVGHKKHNSLFKCYYNALTSGGNSGSAVTVKVDQFGKKTVGYRGIAVHTNGHHDCNSGVRFTKEIEGFIINAVRKLDESRTTESVACEKEINKILQEHHGFFSIEAHRFLQSHMTELVSGLKDETAYDHGKLFVYLSNFFSARQKR